jgi:hypothetical protein
MVKSKKANKPQPINKRKLKKQEDEKELLDIETKAADPVSQLSNTKS